MFIVKGGSVDRSDTWVAPKNDMEGVDHSIEKWTFIGDHLKANPNLNWIYDGSRETCGLCNLHNTFEMFVDGTSCDDCPIYKATGVRYCEGTPYKEYDDIVNDEYESYESMRRLSIAAAEAEIEFLVSIKAGLEAVNVK